MRPLQLILVLALPLLFDCQQKPPKPPGFTSHDPAPDAVEKGRPMMLHRNDLAWLVENSTLVFVGRLLGKDVEKDDRGLIFTRNKFEIEKLIIGTFKEKSITLTTLGGTLGDQTLRVSHMPVFVEGRQYVIFTDTNRTTYDPITGNQDGVFLVGPQDSGIYNYNGVSVAEVEKGIITLGGQILKEYFEPDSLSLVSSPMRENPEIQGDIVSVERSEIAVKPAISLDQFIEIVRGLSPQR